MTNEQKRIAWVEKVLKTIPEGHTILDAGAGEQQYRKFCSHLKYTSQDFAAYDPSKEKKGLQMEQWDYGKLDIVSDILNIPVADASFDAILCTEVFEHIPDPVSAIREFSRILKPGGRLIITAPFCSMTHFAPYHFYSGFNKYFYQHHLPQQGFEIAELTPNGNYFDYLSQETGRIPYLLAEHTGGKISLLHRYLFGMVQKICRKAAVDRNDTSELMCFGWHVQAVKLHTV